MREINENVKMTQVTELVDKHIKTVLSVQGARGKPGRVKYGHGRKKKKYPYKTFRNEKYVQDEKEITGE